MDRFSGGLVCLVMLLNVGFSCNAPQKTGVRVAEKQRGVHLFGRFGAGDLDFLRNDHVEWITLVPWATQRDFDSPEVRYYRRDSTEIARHDSMQLRRIALVHGAGYKVMLKPHVWINAPTPGTWRSDIYPSSEANWQTWRDSYREYILRYARLAERGDVELFCIGTEFTRLTTEYPEFWRELIVEVRAVYSGQLTYAANWYQEFDRIDFWDQLDLIGVQAYFPLVDKNNPSVEEISAGWARPLSELKRVSERYQRPVLFTELGYKSTSDSATKPWEWVEDPEASDRELSHETQANCYAAFFESVWVQTWFAGAHLWQFRPEPFGGYPTADNLDFTPQGKPAEEVITRGFTRTD